MSRPGTTAQLRIPGRAALAIAREHGVESLEA